MFKRRKPRRNVRKGKTSRRRVRFFGRFWIGFKIVTGLGLAPAGAVADPGPIELNPVRLAADTALPANLMLAQADDPAEPVGERVDVQAAEEVEEPALPISLGLSYALYSDYIFRGVNFSEYAGEGREFRRTQTRNMRWAATALQGIEQKVLYEDDRFPDVTQLERWATGAAPGPREFPGGVEFFVIMIGRRYGKGHTLQSFQ